MVLPISCNECRRRKIRCDRVEPCKNCSSRSITCTYPSKFRSIEIKRLNQEPTPETMMGIEHYQSRVKELETRLAISEDLISIFDSSGESATKYFGPNSINVLETEMMNGILPFEKDTTLAINLKKKELPVLIDNDPERNKKIIKSLVQFFFKEDQYYYYNEMIDKDEVFEFLDNYDKITKWSHDEDIILLCCILVDVLKNGINDREPQIIPNQELKIKSLITHYFQISKIHTTETKKFLQSQLIMMNYYYFIYSFEKCWKLLFQLVSNAYSLGLHIEGGSLWTKINTMEALLCSASSRPNIIHGDDVISEEQKKSDEFEEYKFCEILRIKNGLYVSSYVHKTSIAYQDILAMDAKYEEYNRFLEAKIVKNYDADDVETSKTNEKAYILLLMSYATQMKIHFESFEKERFSDGKIMDLSTRFINVLGHFVYGRLNTLRDKFSALECFFYQFLLIFLKYLNFKSVGSMMMRKSAHDNISLSKILNHVAVDEEIQGLLSLRSRLLEIFGKNSLTNQRLMKVLAIIKSVDWGESSTTSLIGNKDTGDYYITPELKDLLEDPVYDVLKSITEFQPTMSSHYIDNTTMI